MACTCKDEELQRARPMPVGLLRRRRVRSVRSRRCEDALDADPRPVRVAIAVSCGRFARASDGVRCKPSCTSTSDCTGGSVCDLGASKRVAASRGTSRSSSYALSTRATAQGATSQPIALALALAALRARRRRRA
jgi:hypothetical protein